MPICFLKRDIECVDPDGRGDREDLRIVLGRKNIIRKYSIKTYFQQRENRKEQEREGEAEEGE